MIRINDTIQDFTEKDLESVLKELPEWRKKQLLHFKFLGQRRECALSYLLLCEMLRDRGINIKPTFIYGENGKPSLMELPQLNFNISHCKVAVACALSEDAVGVDVECIGRYSESLARYTMNETELTTIQQSRDPDVEFTRLWTIKEATVKLTGEGICTNMRDTLSHSYNIIYRTIVEKEKGYVATLAKWRKDIVNMD